MLLLTIILEIVIPIFAIIGIGALLQRAFKLDLYTLAKLNIYYILPATIFVKLYQTKLSLDIFKDVLLFFAIYITALYLLSRLAAFLFRFSRGMRIAFTNSVLFDNSGNYGVPLNQLIFKNDPLATSIQVLVLSVQSLITFSYGVIALQDASAGKWKALLGYLKMPVCWGLLLGIAANVTQVSLPVPVVKPLEFISDALVATALATLGAQIYGLTFRLRDFPVYASLLLRLLVGPAIAFAIIWAFGLTGVTAEALLVSSGMPSSVNSAILAQEYGNEPEFASQAVLFSTLLNALTITGVIYAAHVLYG